MKFKYIALALTLSSSYADMTYAGTCPPYKDYEECAKAEQTTYDNEIQNINEDNEMIPSTKIQGRSLASHTLAAGLKECAESCKKAEAPKSAASGAGKTPGTEGKAKAKAAAKA